MPSAVPARPKAHRLLIASVVGLLVIVALGALTATGYASATRWVEHALLVQKAADEWQSVVLEAQSQARACVATSRCPPPAARFDQLNRESAALLRELVRESATQTRAVEAAERQAREVMAFIETQVRLAREGQREQAAGAIAGGQGDRLVAAFRATARAIYAEEQTLLLERRAAARLRAWGTLLAAAVLAAFAGWLLVMAWRTDTRHEAVVNQLAREARDRLRLLSELSTALSTARGRIEIARLLNDYVMRVARGDTCTVYSFSGDSLKLLAHRGIHADMIEKIRVVGPNAGNPLAFDAVTQRRSIWVESEAEYAALYPQLAGMKVPGRRAKAFWSVPLCAEQEVLGLLGVGFYEARHFDADERAFIETLCRQCAEALLRASRAEAERRAQQWFSTTLRSIGDAVIATDESGKITFINPEAERLTGFRESSALGRPLQDVFRVISELTRDPVESPVTQVLRDGHVATPAHHALLQRPTAGEIPIDASGAPIRDEAGEIIGIVLVFRDVTEDEKLESRNAFLAKSGAALASSLDFEQTLATVARFAVPQLADFCAVDLLDEASGRIRQVAVAHVDPEKVRFARSLGERYPQPPSWPSGVPQVIRTGESELYPELSTALIEAQARDAEHLALIQELRLNSALIVPLSSRGLTFGAMTFVYAESGRHYTEDDRLFAEDVARRAALAIENARALREAERAEVRERWLRHEAERANRLKDEILATVSHELRTPLNAILGWTVTLRRGSLPPETERALGIIERNARAQAKLIDDVLDVSRIVSGKLTLQLGPVDLRSAIAAAIETVTPAADLKHVRLSLDIVDDITLTGDADRIGQVIWNLLSNSVKFTPAEGSVRVRLLRDGDDACISVADTGEGIRADKLATIFEPFEQADNSSSRRHGGLGLGLSIVKQLTAAHGGTVSVASAGPGRGSTFTVRLPIARSRGEASAAPMLRSLTPAPGPSLRLAARLDGLRVLVVEDEPDSRLLASDILSRQGAEVDLAESVAEALAKFSPERHDVIVSDIGMPGEDGYSLIRKVRASGSHAPAVALTAYVSPQDARRALAAGFQKHLKKPVDPAELVTAVASLRSTP